MFFKNQFGLKFPSSFFDLTPYENFGWSYLKRWACAVVRETVIQLFNLVAILNIAIKIVLKTWVLRDKSKEKLKFSEGGS